MGIITGKIQSYYDTWVAPADCVVNIMATRVDIDYTLRVGGVRYGRIAHGSVDGTYPTTEAYICGEPLKAGEIVNCDEKIGGVSERSVNIRIAGFTV